MASGVVTLPIFETPAAAPAGRSTGTVGQPNQGASVAIAPGSATSTTNPTVPMPVLTFIAHGSPKPKGSMRHVGKGRLVEQVEGRPWREAVKWAAMEAIRANPRCDIEHKASGVTFRGFPLHGALRVEATFTFAKPASAPKRRQSWPTTRASGDADKQLRNLYDAMQDAGVMRDDAQIVEGTVAKRYPLEGPDALNFPGVVVRVFLLSDPRNFPAPDTAGEI